MGRVTVGLLATLVYFCSVLVNELVGFQLFNLQVMKLVFLGGGSLLLLWRPAVTWLLLRSLNPWFLAFIALGWCSTLWSIESKLTFLRMLTMTGYLLIIAAFVVYDWSRDRFQSIMRGILLSILLLAYAVWIVDPSFVIEVGDDISLKGSWKGVTSQKNTFGQIAAFSAVLWWHAVLTHEVGSRRAKIGFALSFYAVLLSRSSTSLMACVLTCAFLVLLLRSPRNLKRYMPFIAGAFALLVVTYSVAVLKVVPGLDLLLEPIAMLTGKDQTFSGRSLIWDVMKKHISFAPILGTGWGAYWAGPEYKLSPSWDVARVMYIYPFQAHNGYLDVINDLGYVGLLVLVGYMLVFMRQSLMLFRVDKPQGALFLALFFMAAISNLSQSIWFTSNIEFVLMIVATFALGRSITEVKLAALYLARPTGALWEHRSQFMRR